MDSEVIQTEHSSLDDPLSVHPWANLLQKLHDDIDDDTLDRLIFLSRAQLSKRQLGEITGDRKFDRWITALETKLGDNDIVTFIINLLKCEQLHKGLGETSWAEIVRQYQSEKELFLQKCAERGLCQDVNFTGRHTLIQEVIDIITAPTDSKKGVILCGQSGMGKTSVANEVCHRLMYGQQAWDILVCNQREKSSLRELLADLISVFEPETVVDPGSSVKDLKIQLGHLITENLDARRILLLDNLDLHCDTQPKLEALHALIKDILRHIRKSPNLRLLATVGRKLNFEDEMPGWRNARFGGDMLEIELRPLTNEETAALLKKVTKLSDEDLPETDCSKVRGLCGGNPMAIRTVASMLQYGCSMNDIISCLQHDSSRQLADGQLETCIRKSISLLGNDQSTEGLVQLLAALSLFQSAHFDISAAIAVGTDSKGMGDTMSFATRQKNAYGRIEEAMMEYKLINLKSRHLIEIDKMTQKRGRESRHVYSLHPLIFKYLKKIVNESEELTCHCSKAKSFFLRHFYSVVQKCGKYVDTDPLKAKQIIEQNEVHIREFFKLLATDVHISELTVTKDKQTHHQDTILEHKRIWKVAEFVTASNSIEQKLFARKQAELAKEDKQLYEYIHWTCLEVDHLLMNDRWELAEEHVDKLSRELGVVMQGSEEQGEGFGCLYSPEWKENEDEKIPVVATLYAVKGRICKEKNMLENALDNFTTANILYRGKQIIPNVIESKKDGKRIYKKSSYMSELAQVMNLIGRVYFEKKQLDNARKFHEEALDKIESLCCGQTRFHKDAALFITNVGACLHQLGLTKSKHDPDRENCLEKALAMYEKSQRYNKIMKRDKLMGEAYTLRNIADVYYNKKEKNVEKALRFMKQALSIFEKLVKAPNVDLTLMISQIAHYHLQLGRLKKKDHNPEEAETNFEDSITQYDKALLHIRNGGLPIDHNQDRTYPRIKANHLKALNKAHYPRSLIQDRTAKYSEFERGKRDKRIQDIRRKDWDFDSREVQRKAAAEGKTFLLERCSDDGSSSEDDSEETPSSESSSRSSRTSTSSSGSSSDEELSAMAVLTRRRKDSGFDAEEDLGISGEMMDIEGRPNVSREIINIKGMPNELDLGHTDKQHFTMDMGMGTNEDRQRFGSEDVKPSENVSKIGTLDSNRKSQRKPLLKQASIDLPVIPDIPNIDNCSDIINEDCATGVASVESQVEEMEDNCGSSQVSVTTDNIKSGDKESVGDVPTTDNRASFDSQSSRRDSIFSQNSQDEMQERSCKSTLSGSESERGSLMDERRESWRNSKSRPSWASGGSADVFEDSRRASTESQDSLLMSGGVTRKRPSWTSGGSYEGSHRASTESQDSLMMSGGATRKRPSWTSGGSYEGSHRASTESQDSLMMSGGATRKRPSWTSGGSYEGSHRASTESQDSLMSGDASRKRKSWANTSGSQDSLSSRLSQLFLLNPKSFEDGEGKASSKKKSRKDKM